MEAIKFKLESDLTIVERILEGEPSLFEILIRRHNPALYKVARTYGFNHQDAEDLMQEAHVAAFTNLKKFRKEASYKTWITRILLNKCYHKATYGSLKFEDERSVSEWNMPASSNTENTMLNKELGNILERSLEQLPVIYRTVFVLREVEGFSVAETAEMLDISETNVKVRTNRAKAMLQKELEKFYSSAELYEFNLIYCDAIVEKVFARLPGY